MRPAPMMRTLKPVPLLVLSYSRSDLAERLAFLIIRCNKLQVHDTMICASKMSIEAVLNAFLVPVNESTSDML